MISLIAALDESKGIGYKNALPWHIPDDLKRFKKITTGKTILMGRKTYDSIGKPLPNRKNFVLSFNHKFTSPGTTLISNNKQLSIFLAEKENEEVFVIGGSSIYKLFLPLATKLYLTLIKGSFKCDSFFPKFDYDDFDIIKTESQLKTTPHWQFKILKRKLPATKANF